MKGIAAYARNRVESAPNEQILVMLLEKALEKEAAALVCIEARDRGGWNKALHTCRAIFIELLSALDQTEAPEVTVPLARTWSWCMHQLLIVGKTGDAALLGKVQDVTRMMHETWSEAITLRDGQQAAS